MQRYRISLVADPPTALAPWQPELRLGGTLRQKQQWAALEAFFVAMRRAQQKGSGSAAWASVLDDPLSFLLDGISDALLVRDLQGEVVFSNTRARDLNLSERRFCPHQVFERMGESYQERGLRLEMPGGGRALLVTLVCQLRR